MNRRSFLRQTALAGSSLPLLAAGAPIHAFANALGASPFTRAASDEDDRILVILRLDGGADGLNTLVPYHDDDYYRARRRGLGNDISIHPERVVPLRCTHTLGLHPSLAPLAELFEEDKVAIVQNVGYDNVVMSHFRSNEIWMSATDAGQFVGTGWLARAFETAHPAYPGTLGEEPYAIEFGTRMSTAFLGEHGDVGMAHTEIGYIPERPEPDERSATRAALERRHVETVMRQSGTFSRSIVAARDRVRHNNVEYPKDLPIADGNRFSAQLAETARLIASGLGTRVYLVSLPFYDFHIRQLTRERAQHESFARSVLAFQRDLEAFGVSRRVTMLTISEFGRRVESQGTGTDHGGAAPLLVIGEGVAAGVYGHDPDLNDLVAPGNLRPHYDYRQVYASVMSQWLGASNEMLSSALHGRRFTQIPLFNRLAARPPVSTELIAGIGPNPATVATTVRLGALASSPARLSIYSVQGRPVLTRDLYPGTSNVRIDVRTLLPGHYVCEIVDGDRRDARPLTVVR